MARFGYFTIRTAEYRPCYVMEGTMYVNDVAFERKERKALFHRWTDIPYVSPSKYFAGLSEEKATEIGALAIVEYEDGTIARVFPEDVRFVPGIMNEYNFGEAAENETRNATD